MGCFSGIRSYQYLLEGHIFHMLTDHKPLIMALLKVSEAWLAKQQLQLGFYSIAEFTSDI